MQCSHSSRDTSPCKLWRQLDTYEGRLLAWTVSSYSRKIWWVSGWEHVNSQKPSIRSENGLFPFEKTYVFSKKCSNIQMYNQAVPRKQLTKRRISCKVIFLSCKQYILRSSALCQVANKGRILHSWDHVAGEIRLMGLGLNSTPTSLRRTNAGFFQMSVPTVPQVENCFMARKRAQWF